MTTTADLLTIEAAAEKLSLSPEALRARCRRGAADEVGRTELGPSVVALKLGRSWRIAMQPFPVVAVVDSGAVNVRNCTGATEGPLHIGDSGDTKADRSAGSAAGHAASPPVAHSTTAMPRRFSETTSPVRYNSRRRRWVVDFRFTDSAGVRRRYRRDATVQTATSAQAEAERLMTLARTTGRIPPGGVPTFAEFVRDYFAKIYVPAKCRPATAERYAALMRQGLTAFFGPKRLDAIAAPDFRQYAAVLGARGVGVKAHLSLARTVLRAALEAGHLARLPDLPKLPKAGKKLPVSPGATAIHVLLENSRGWVRVAIALAAYGGLRAGEVRALEVRDVDLGLDQLLVRRAFSADRIFPPKSGDERVVPIVRRLRDVIASAIERKSPHDRVVLRDDGSTPRRQVLLTAFYATQEPLIERQLLDRRWSFHQLRHFFCSELVRLGASVEAVRLLAGHSDIKTTQRYVHARAEELRQTMLKLDA